MPLEGQIIQLRQKDVLSNAQWPDVGENSWVNTPCIFSTPNTDAVTHALIAYHEEGT